MLWPCDDDEDDDSFLEKNFVNVLVSWPTDLVEMSGVVIQDSFVSFRFVPIDDVPDWISTRSSYRSVQWRMFLLLLLSQQY